MLQEQWNKLIKLILSLRAKFWKINSGMDAFVNLQFGTATADCLTKIQHLKLIYSRISYGIAKTKSKVERWIRYGEFDGCIFDTLSLDLEDFFIHSRMLLDKIAYVTHLLFRDEPSLPYRSFNKHRDFFFKDENNPWPPDEEYAKYIREKTDWFEKDLKDPRDDLIVHSAGKGESLQMSENIIECHRIGILGPLREKLGNLFKKYKIPMSDLTVEGSPIEQALQVLENNKSLLDPKDLETLSKIKQKVGGKLPDIELLLKNLLVFLEFFGKHFSQKLDQSEVN